MRNDGVITLQSKTGTINWWRRSADVWRTCWTVDWLNVLCSLFTTSYRLLLNLPLDVNKWICGRYNNGPSLQLIYQTGVTLMLVLIITLVYGVGVGGGCTCASIFYVILFTFTSYTNLRNVSFVVYFHFPFVGLTTCNLVLNCTYV